MAGDEPNAIHSDGKLDLSALPHIFVSATHFDTADLHTLEDELCTANASLTYDIHEARLVLTKVTRKKRVQFDLRAKGLWTEEVNLDRPDRYADKRQRLESAEDGEQDVTEVIVVDDESSTASEGESPQATSKAKATVSRPPNGGKGRRVRTPTPDPAKDEFVLKVVRTDWFEDAKKAGEALPLDPYLIFQCRPIARPWTPEPSETSNPTDKSPKTATSSSRSIIKRAKEDAPAPSITRVDRFGKRKFNAVSRSAAGASWEAGGGGSNSNAYSTSKHPPRLEHTTTSDHEGSAPADLPPMPDWVQRGAKYACMRPTPRESPNDAFIALLKKIKLARLLTNDEIGVRAYSTSIASLAAYPYELTSAREILRLPGCEGKIARLWEEWTETGKIQAVEEFEADGEMKVLRLFYEIWGVGATTAREFYYDRGWNDLDDVVEHGWSTLQRVQQIGVKYYDEFLDPIPRAEVAKIGQIVHEHAVRVRDDRVQSMIVGGYRRGKQASGDVDIIVSHPDEDLTLNVVSDIVASLEEEGWVTHTLLLSLNSTHRGQKTLPYRGGAASGGHGFDTLDKALVVWQDPEWDTREADLARDPEAKNPNIHRRVDIIVSPWRTVGCAVVGWSGGTTFQRDLRRYAKNIKGWKFDSSGVRSRMNGEVLDLEGWHGYQGAYGEGRAKTMEQAERRVFEGFELVYREPWERCTG